MWWMAVSGERMHTLYFTSLFLLADTLASPGRKKHFITLALSGIGTLLLSAPHLLPAALASNDFAAAGEKALQDGRLWPLNPLRIIEMWSAGPLLLPDGNAPDHLFQLSDFHSYWANSLYVGALVIITSMIALRWPLSKRPVYLLTGLGIITFCSALGTGTNTPLFHLFQKILPGFSLLRYPEKNFVFVAFSLTMLSGFGTEKLLTAKGFGSVQAWSTLQRGLAAIAGANLLLACLSKTTLYNHCIFILSGSPPKGENDLELLNAALLQVPLSGAVLAILTLGGICIVHQLNSSKKYFRYSPAFLTLLLFFTLAVGTWNLWGSAGEFNRHNTQKLFDAPVSVKKVNDLNLTTTSRITATAAKRNVPTEFLQKHPDMFLPKSEVLRLTRQGLAKNINALYNIENIVGYLPLTCYSRQTKIAELPDSAYWNGFNVRYALRQKAAEDITSIDDLYDVLTNENAGERIRLVRGIPVHSMEEAIQIANRPGFNAVTEIPVEVTVQDSADYPATAPQNARADVVTYSPEYIEVNTASETPSTLFVADAFADGWTATVDGAPAPIHPGLIAGRALPLTKGKHKIVMTYKTPGLRLGIGLSLLGWVGLIALALLHFRRTKEPRQNPSPDRGPAPN